MRNLPFHLDVLVEMEDGDYVAHCLQLDLVAVASTEEAAMRDMLDLIQAQIQFAVENDNLENIFRPAPAEFWEKLWRAKQLEKPICQRESLTVDNKRSEADFCYAYAS